MCNRYTLEQSFFDIAGNYHAIHIGDCEIKGDIFPRALAPGLLCNADGERELHAMQFSFAPPRSETPSHPKFICNNTRVEEVSNPKKWPWFDSIETSRCVVPMNAFREACYWGDPEGTEVYFHRPDNALLHAAGIYRIWKSPSDNTQLHTMSLLMKPAGDYVMDHGHHRQPILIEASGISEWINPRRIERDAAVEILRRNLADHELTHRHARDMSEGWKKRKSGNVRKRGQQLQAIEECTHPCGF